MAQIAPPNTDPVSTGPSDHSSATAGPSLNPSPAGEAIQSPNTASYTSASPVTYNAPHLYPSNVVPYGSSSLSGANILPTPVMPASYPLTSSQPPTSMTSAAAKRKQPDDSTMSASSGAGPSRKRRQQSVAGAHTGEGTAERDDADVGPNGGPKHWTDSEKSNLFTWLLASDKNWDMFKTKMNTVFRDASAQIFGGRKSFTALKSCYHRNVETFKQIYAFEAFLAQLPPDANNPNNPASGHTDPTMARQAYLEQRLEDARTAGAPVANLNVRVIDHWHQNGWYTLFKSRFREDPRTGLPVPFYGPRSMSFPDGPPIQELAYATPGIDPQLTNEDAKGDVDIDDDVEDAEQEGVGVVPDATASASGAIVFSSPLQTPNNSGDAFGGPPAARSRQTSLARKHLGSTSFVPDQSHTVEALDRLTVATQTLVDQCTTLTQLLRVATEDQKVRKTGGGGESGLNRKEKASLAMEALANGDVGEEVRRAAADYLKRLFASE
ncbi:uncharacterized protein FIBRA_00164 [Fibroporia radiculosa]|uniref:Uncharacterized protein n=1 Tax=Fibroporia radiculosa TaxID=599839 RepID=J7RV31_9APHY|nr:uncharacterized protein FIBRA_00164 [Fibroporia radiculosa]CCL98170.1 predicted protein [Fibroporia radiculosa]